MLGLLLPSACSKEEKKAGLVVAVQTDMSVPKDVDAVEIQVSAYGKDVFKERYTVGKDGQIYIPATITLLPPKEKNTPVTIKVVSFQKGDARTLRRVVTTVPDSREALLRMPISWLCDGEVKESAEELESSCKKGSSCLAGSCESDEVDASTLDTFVPQSVFGKKQDGKNTCFDTVPCFAAHTPVAQLGLDTTTCTLDLDRVEGEELDPDTLNFALKSNAGDGICGEGDLEAYGCFVPLENDEATGWTLDGSTVQLPKALCDDAREGTELVLSTACATRSAATPPCGDWTGTEGSAITVPLDELPEPPGSGGSGTGGGDVGTGGGDVGSGGSGGVPGSGGGGGTPSIAGIPLIFDNGWVDGATNPLDIQGELSALADDATFVGMTSNFTGSNACIAGTAALVDTECSPIEPYSSCEEQYWGAAINLNLNQYLDEGSQPGVPFPYDASQLDGFAFEISGDTIPSSLRFAIHDVEGIEYCTQPIVSGKNVVYFDELMSHCWTSEGSPAYVSSLINLTWQVATNSETAVPFDFCVSNLVALTPGASTCEDHCRVTDIGSEVPNTVESDNLISCDMYVDTCGGSKGNEHAFEFTAPESASYTFDTNGSSLDTVLAVYSGLSCGGALACDDDGGAGGGASSLSISLAASETVRVVVRTYYGDAGAITLNVTQGDSLVHGMELVSGAQTGGQGNGDAGYQGTSVSADGRYVAFVSHASNLVVNDTNGFEDVFVRDRETGFTERVNVSTAGTESNNALEGAPVISADGRYVAFASYANNLVSEDTNGTMDVFVRDLVLGTTERVSVSSAGVEGNNTSGGVAMSADGRFVAFYSFANNLVASDLNSQPDVFVRDRQAGTTERVSLTESGTEGFGGSGDYGVAISSNGQYVAFTSRADLSSSDMNGYSDVYVRDRVNGITELVSVNGAGVVGNSYSGDYGRIAMSADGRFIAFASDANNLVAADTNGYADVFLRDRQSGTTERVSVDSSEQEVTPDSNGYGGLCVSYDGRFVAFTSNASSLAQGTVLFTSDLYVRDRQNGVTRRVAMDEFGVGANSLAMSPSFSNNGFVVFSSYAENLVPGDTNGVYDVFIGPIEPIGQ